jgi:myo-inositol 2-dehydrogenase / D-chiro-inositol 1-dehydrogenase
MSHIRIGLLGAGRIGQVHARTIIQRVPTARLVAVADPMPGVAQQLADRYAIATATTDCMAVINDPSIDAVMICTPTDTHCDYIIAAAARGKHIFCEKPVALDLAQTDRALTAVENAGVKLQLGFNRRFDANFARIREAVQGGHIGTPKVIHIVSRDPAPPPVSYIKVSGGIFLDMTIHDWDIARFLIGSDIAEVYVQGGVTVDPAIGEAGDIDTHVTMIRFENGVIGTIDNCRQAVYGYDQRAEVFGSAGSIETGNNYPNNTVLSTASSVQRDLPLNFFMQRYIEAYAAEIEAFVAAVVNDTPVAVDGHDARKALIAGLAAWKSYREGRPVKLVEIG